MFSFCQRSATFGGYLITEESYLSRSEDALCRVNDDPVCLNTEPRDVARAPQVIGRTRGCHPSRRNRSWFPAEHCPWSVGMSGRRCASRRTWKETRSLRVQIKLGSPICGLGIDVQYPSYINNSSCCILVHHFIYGTSITLILTYKWSLHWTDCIPSTATCSDLLIS
jgi:hypothetical protein